MTIKEAKNLLDTLIPNFGDYELTVVINDENNTILSDVVVIRNDDETVTLNTKPL